MKKLNDLFISAFEPTLAAKGFKRKRNVFHRIHGEKILQIISVVNFKYSFTIQYDILPLCIHWPFDFFMLDGDRIGSLIGSEASLEWNINDELEVSVAEAYNKCEELLFEWFDYVEDYKTFSNFLLIQHEKYLKRLDEKYIKAYAGYLKVPKGGFYEVSLALGEYDNAMASLEQLLYIKNEYIRRMGERGIEPDESVFNEKKDVLNKMRLIDEYQNGISSPKQFLEENEAKLLYLYSKKYC